MGELQPLIIGLLVLLFVAAVAGLGTVSRRRADRRDQRARASAVLHDSLRYGEDGDGPTCEESASPAAPVAMERDRAFFERSPAPCDQTPPADYAMMAPVELHFDDGEGRVGVKGGTALHTEFAKVADSLLEDLEGSRRR